jgi:hypothetical protein
MLFVDAGNNRVGIGAAPSNPFEVNAGSGNAFIYTTGVTALVAQADAAGDTLILQTTDTSATNGPNIKFRRVATGADNDGLMQLGVNGFNDTGTEEIQFFRQRHFIIDASDGTEDGAFDMFNMIGGSLRSIINHDSTATIFNDNSVDIDFRVESESQANFLLLDASAEMLLVGGGANTAGGAAFKVTQGNDGELSLDSTSAESNIVSYDRNGGAYHPLNIYGSNVNINTITGGSAIFNEASLDADFRVESASNTHALFVDAGNDRVAIGTSTTTELFNVGGSMELRSTSINLDFMETGVADANFRLRQNTGNFFIQKLTDDKATSTEYYRADGGAGNIFNDNSVDLDFRVESDSNAHALFVDASESTVGINTTATGATALNISGGNSDTYGQVRIAVTGSADAQVSLGTTSNGRGFYVDESSTNDFVIYGGAGKGGAGEFKISNLGNVTINGSLSKSSGSFRIPHPIASKTETHDLIHSFVEAPQADNIYRGKVDLVAGQAAVNIDTVAGMTDGTFALLNREIQCFTSNETGWTAVRGSVSGNILTIEAQDNTCTDTISWLVIGERQDQHMYDTEWTDENGKVIVEPLKS